MYLVFLCVFVVYMCMVCVCSVFAWCVYVCVVCVYGFCVWCDCSDCVFALWVFVCVCLSVVCVWCVYVCGECVFGVCMCDVCVCVYMYSVYMCFLILFINSMLHYHASVILHAWLGHLRRNWNLI